MLERFSRGAACTASRIAGGSAALLQRFLPGDHFVLEPRATVRADQMAGREAPVALHAEEGSASYRDQPQHLRERQHASGGLSGAFVFVGGGVDVGSGIAHVDLLSVV